LRQFCGEAARDDDFVNEEESQDDEHS